MYLWEIETAWVGEGQREWETQNPKQAPGSELSAQSPLWGLNPWTVRSWPEPKSATQPTEPPRRPKTLDFKVAKKEETQVANQCDLYVMKQL